MKVPRLLNFNICGPRGVEWSGCGGVEWSIKWSGRDAKVAYKVHKQLTIIFDDHESCFRFLLAHSSTVTPSAEQD